MRPISPSQALNMSIMSLRAHQVPYLAGPPGIGKSDIAKQVADYYGLFLIDIRLSQMLPEDMIGLPNLNEKKGKAVYTEFETFPMEGDEIPDGYNGWLILLDELSSASEECLAASYSIILDHMVGGKKIHSEARVMAAGNRAEDSAIARQLPDTIITRVLPVEVKPSVKDWLAWAETTEHSNPHTISFVKKYPDLLIDMSPAADRGELDPYPNPRAWGRTMRIMNLFEKLNKPKPVPREDIPGIPAPGIEEELPSKPIDEVTFHMLEAAVGSVTAQAYKEDYNESLCLPTPMECAQTPASTSIPSTGAGKSTLVNSLAKYHLVAPESARDGVLQYMNRIGGEYSSLFVQIIIDNLGQKPSEVKLINNIKKTLGVTELDLGDIGKSSMPDDPAW